MGKKLGLTSVALLLLAGCSDPLRGVDRLSSVDVADTPEQVEIAATTEKQPAEEGVFSGFFKRRAEAKDAPTVGAEADAEIAKDGDVATTKEKPSNATAPETAASEPVLTETRPVVRKSGLFGLFSRPKQTGEPEIEASPEPETPAAISAEDGQKLIRPETLGVAAEVTAAEALATAPEAQKPKRRGLFGRQAPAEGNAEVAALGPRKDVAPKRNRRGRIDPNAPDAAETTLSNVQAFGSVARLCDQPTRALGKEVARYPEKGRGYRIYDSQPGSTTPRSFYITGFDDGCARQFTAALAIFGSPGMHEQLRYGLPAKVQPYSDTDKAYEKVKSKVCRVSRQKPCGDRLAKLESNTVFVSYYERFGGNARWANFLLHDGALEAKDIKSK